MTPVATTATAAPSRRPPARTAPARGAAHSGKVFLALLSVLILTGTGYAWANFKQLSDNLTTTDVIGKSAGGEKPADGSVDILLVGMDSRTDTKGNPLPEEVLWELQAGGSEDGGFNTDTMIVMHIPNDGGKAVALSFPRDSYVKIAGGYGKHKLNSAYSFAKNDAATELQRTGVSDPAQVETESRKDGAKNLIATLQDLTGLTIDHYAEVNLVGFYEITNAIQGIDVCLLGDVDETKSGARFTAGKHTIQGRDALAFVRQRLDLPRGDLDRVVRQQVFMAGLAKKMLSAGVLADQGKLKALITAVTKSIVLDQGWDVLGFAQQMQGLSGGKIEFKTIPIGDPDLQTPEDGSAVEVDADEVREFVKNLDVDPAKTSASAEPAVVAAKSNATVTVDVRNASGVPGLAAKVLQSLVAKGFTEGGAANADTDTDSSVVRYGQGGEAGAQQVAKALGGLKTARDDDIPTGHARVFVGSDYAGPGAQGFSGGGRLGLDGARRQPPAAEPPITATDVVCVN